MSSKRFQAGDLVFVGHSCTTLWSLPDLTAKEVIKTGQPVLVIRAYVDFVVGLCWAGTGEIKAYALSRRDKSKFDSGCYDTQRRHNHSR